MSDDGYTGGCGCMVLIALLVGAWWLLPLGDCRSKIQTLWHQEWTGYAYPDPGNLARSIAVGTFDSKESCLSAARQAAGPYGDVECGLNCRFEDGTYVCVETVGR